MSNKKCPLQKFLRELGGKWSLVIVWHINDGKTGFNEIKKAIGPISAKVLSEKLKDLQLHKVITRKTLGGNPPRVKYQLTKKGHSLLPVMTVLHDWGDKHL